MQSYGQNLPTRKITWLFSITLILVSWLIIVGASAATLYVSDTTLKANVRTGTSIDNRIIAMLTPGTVVTLVAEEDGWAEVSLDDGRTGWILRRYLSERPPWRVTAEKLAREGQELRARLGRVELDNRTLTQRNATFEKEVNQRQQELESVRKEYEDLKKSAANYLSLKMAYENLQAEAGQSKAKLDEVQKAYGDLKLSTNIRWFLSGAGVLLLGWLGGLSLGRMRRRRSGDLYRL